MYLERGKLLACVYLHNPDNPAEPRTRFRLGRYLFKREAVIVRDAVEFFKVSPVATAPVFLPQPCGLSSCLL